MDAIVQNDPVAVLLFLLLVVVLTAMLVAWRAQLD
jgi:hypothetical protein